ALCCIAAPTKVLTHIGIVSPPPGRFCAVTTLSCRPPAGAVASVAAFAAPAAVSHTPVINTMPGSCLLIDFSPLLALVAPHRCYAAGQRLVVFVCGSRSAASALPPAAHAPPASRAADRAPVAAAR